MANVVTILTDLLGKTDAKSLIQDSVSLKDHAQLARVAVKLVEAGCVLSGSYALKLQGLLPEERVVHDLDVVMHGTPTDVLEKLEQVLGVQAQGIQSEEEYEGLLIRFEVDGVKVDAFPRANPVRLDPNNPFLLHPADSLGAKAEILLDRRGKKDDTYAKHLADFNYIFNGG